MLNKQFSTVFLEVNCIEAPQIGVSSLTAPYILLHTNPIPSQLVGMQRCHLLFALNMDISQVAIRVRPPLQREFEGYHPFQNTALVSASQRILTVSENLQSIEDGGAAADAGLVSPETHLHLRPARSNIADPNCMSCWSLLGAGVRHIQVHLRQSIWTYSGPGRGVRAQRQADRAIYPASMPAKDLPTA